MEPNDIHVIDFLKTVPLIFLAALAFIGILKLIFKKSIVFTITAITTIPIVIAAIAGMVMGTFGVKHLLWIFPVVVVMFIGIFYWLANTIRKPLNKITANMTIMAQGDIDVKIEDNDIKGKNEFAEDFRSMKALVEGLQRMADFATKIGHGKLGNEYELLSDKDVLGQSLREMQHNLQAAQTEQENYKQQEQDRNWMSQGLANFGDILRKNNDQIDTLCFEIISNLVKYLEANQGGIFIINDTDQEHVFLEQRACYAFDRRKFLEKIVEPGEGLVGACWKEKASIYMTDIPNDYINIHSGLGGSRPRALLIAPLKLNDKIYGIVEIASFKPLKPFQITFVEQVGESIAATISSVKVAERTQKLLEQTQLQTQGMSEQEEELRQNMEELQATQEESARREAEAQAFLKALYSSVYIIEFDADLKISNINDLLLNLINASREKVVGLSYKHFVPWEYDQEGQSYEEMWQDIFNGNPRSSLDRVDRANGEYLLLREHYAPIPDYTGRIYKVIAFATIEHM